MREIKFRAFDKENNELITGDDNQGVILGEEGGYFDLRESPDRYIVMESTGLKDKNEREIFNGDIVKGISHYTNGSKEIIGQVKYSGDKYVLCNKKGDPIVYFDTGEIHICGLECWAGYNDDDEYIFEVLGNIYKNKELLK